MGCKAALALDLSQPSLSGTCNEGRVTHEEDSVKVCWQERRQVVAAPLSPRR